MEKKSKMSFLSYLGHSRPLKWMLDVNKESFYNQTFCFAVIIHSSRVKYRLFKIRLSFWLIGSEMSNDIIISESTFFFSHTYIHFFNVHKYLKDQTIYVIQFSATRRCTLCQDGKWSFQTGDTKLERFLPKIQRTQQKLLNFEFWINDELTKVPKFDVQNFSMSKIIWIFLIFFIEEYQFRSTLFLSHVDSYAKIFLILHEISTARTAIMQNLFWKLRCIKTLRYAPFERILTHWEWYICTITLRSQIKAYTSYYLSRNFLSYPLLFESTRLFICSLNVFSHAFFPSYPM